MTFREPAVRETMSWFALVKLDIDAVENRSLCEKYHRQGGVPAFAILNTSGRVQDRWVGALASEDLIERLHKVLETEPESVKTRVFGPREQLWLECENLRESSLWEALAVSTRRYLDEFPADSREEEAKVLLGLAQVEIGGVATPELEQHIEELIEVMGIPFPGSGLLDRIENRLFGRSKAEDQAADQWVETANETSARLRVLGRSASGPLRKAMLGSNTRAAVRAAQILGQMRLPETREFLLVEWNKKQTAIEHRVALAECMGNQNHPMFLDPLIACLGSDSEHARVRQAAAESLRDIVVGQNGSRRPDLARAVEAGLNHGDRKLREWCLQLAFEVKAPIDLGLLTDLLSDRRSLFEDYRICDNALWILCRQLGKEVRGGDDDSYVTRCEPELAAFLSEWYRTPGRDLRWNPVTQSYQER